MKKHSQHQHGTHGGDHDSQATFGMHGQLFFGGETVYVSHLPMFMFDEENRAHNYQVILEVSLADGSSDPHAVYLNDRRQTGTRLYTLAPELFSLTELFTPDPEAPSRRSFKGALFREHFERGGIEIARGQVNVEKVVYVHEFQKGAEGLDRLEYLLFGRGEELFLVHIITKPPDFDQVLSVEISGQDFSEEELRAGVRVVFPERGNTIAERVQEGERLQGEVRGDESGSSEARVVEIEVGPEFYFEENELAMPM